MAGDFRPSPVFKLSKKNMNFVFYDTETKGTNTSFDQILQFGAIRTDDQMRELDRFEIRCRILPYVVPSPAAMRVMGVTVDRLRFMKQIITFVSGGSTSVWLLLYLTASGVLVHSTGPYAGVGFGQQQIDCTYFHGTGLVTKTHLYSANGLIGRTVCTRLATLS
jgi:hypothetical protein